MKSAFFPITNIIRFALVILFTSMFAAGCASQVPAASTPTQTDVLAMMTQTAAASASEEATLPPIPTMALASLPTSMVLIEKPVGDSPTATPAAPQVNCTAPAALTAEATEGPYFKAGSPEKTDLYQASIPGTKLLLTGYVLTKDCQPVAHALLDFWQADGNGQYDNNGFTLRGHQFTDDSGRYQLATVVPGLYPGRTEHIHVKVQAPNGPVKTSQLFFPGVQSNQSDSIFDPSLLMTVQETSEGVQAQFNFILAP